MTSSAEVTLLLTMVVVTECQNTFVKCMPTSQQKLLNSTNPTACPTVRGETKMSRNTGVFVKPILSNEFNFRGHQHVFNVCIRSFSRTLALWMPWLIIKTMPMDVL